MRLLQLSSGLGLSLLGVSLLGVASAGGQAALSPAVLAGQWSGPVTEPLSGLHYAMLAQILPRADVQGRFAKVHYTNDTGCDVEWFLTGQTTRTLKVQEKVLDGPCVNVALELSLDRSGPRPTLKVVSYDDGSGQGTSLNTATFKADLQRR